MADDASRRREARRRRILENSHNRLQLISGKSSEETLGEPTRPSIGFPIPDTESTGISYSSLCSTSSLNNGAIVTETETAGLLPQNEDIVAAGDRQITNDLAALASPSAQPVPEKSLRDKFFTCKYDIVFLSVLVQLLHRFSLAGIFVGGDSTYFFLPLIIYSATKMFWVPKEKKSNLANVFLLLNGMSANKANTIMTAFQHINAISQDVCIYLFTTICIQSLYSFVSERLVT